MQLTIAADLHAVFGRVVGHLEALVQGRRLHSLGLFVQTEPPLTLVAVVVVVEARDLSDQVSAFLVLAEQPSRHHHGLSAATCDCKTENS